MNKIVAKRIREITERVAPANEDREVQFGDLKLMVRKGVFDPSRGKSARKMARSIELFPPRPGDRMLEIGTGSGVLSIFASKLTGVKPVAVDISPIAINCARENFGRYQVKGRLLVSDLFAKLGGKYDYVIFNAPTAHPSVPADSRGATALWDTSGTIKQRFMANVRGFLDERKRSPRILMMYSIYKDHDSLEKVDFSGFETSRLLVEKDKISESGVMLLTRPRPF